MPRKSVRFLPLVLLWAAVHPATGSDLPANLVVDVRLFEARSTRPDFQAMGNLSFFVDTDGTGISESRWLATIALKVPNSTLATLAYERIPVSSDSVALDIEKRTRGFELGVSLKDFAPQGSFKAMAHGRLRSGQDTVREFDREIELRLGQTYVWSSRQMELSGSEYVSHFRDYQDAKDRGRLYERLRDYSFFLVAAVTLRLADAAESTATTVTLPPGREIPKLDSPLGVPIVGTVVLELALADDGAPKDARVVRSSIPEVNPRILGEALTWSFPQASGKKARIELSLHAEP